MNKFTQQLSVLILTCGAVTPMVNADQVLNDDYIVKGSICIGTDCSSGESFGFDTLRLKENNLRIRFVDSSSSSSFPTNDWQIVVNDSVNGGANKFSIEDIDGGRVPFTIISGADSNSIYVDGNNNVGFGTSTPLVQLHVKYGNTPALRLEQDGSSGFTTQTWDVAGNETNFFVRDISNNSRIPFKIKPGASNDALFIAANGDIGFETSTPDGQFDIAHYNDANDHALLVTSSSTVGINIPNNGVVNGLFDIQQLGDSKFVVQSTGVVGLGTSTPDALLHINKDASKASLLVNTDGVSNSTQLLLDVNGNLVVGADSTNAYSGVTATLDVNGTSHAMIGVDAAATDNTSSFAFSAASTYNWIVSSRNEKATGSDASASTKRLAFYNAGFEEVMTIHQSGNIFIGASVAGSANNTSHALESETGAYLTTDGKWTDASSRALKEDISEISSQVAMETLQALNPVTFAYKKNPTETHAGFIAEDVPNMVASEGRKGLSSMDIVAVLTKVLQEQQNTIKTLNDRLEQLESKSKQ